MPLKQLRASSVLPSQHGSLFPYYHSQQSTHGFDTGSMSLALPGPGPPALVYSNGVAVQYAGMSFRPHIPTYSGQAYSSKMAMQSSAKRGQTHPSASSSGHYYNPHGVSTQACIPSQGHLAAGYTTFPKMSYGHDVDVQKSYSRPYSSAFSILCVERKCKAITIKCCISRPRKGAESYFGQSSETEPIPSYPRGPPRKPKQSGHALWVGNLPLSTTVGALKDHFSREATYDIESVLLISKSNCAFVNYQSETACFAAMDRLHNSRFRVVRLRIFSSSWSDYLQPKSILTPATQWAPRGHILDDSARGTIFWDQAQQQEEGSKQLQDWGESFEVEWISTTRVSFYRTRGLRNPWNENKEIKIARDGTEIEPSIGGRLVQMFHQPAQPLQGARSMPPNITPTTPHFS
ncbi:hypothetical protein E4T44_00647 [Aureobasidium sp. EXF-8845]|nr:hypothetical protein E4T44_00647 [Aureobasidium sp. EXF-8845]KAI4857876.1 hypothetical protein E4T45_00616 [Aureobasidium sp. EXF-8846]